MSEKPHSVDAARELVERAVRPLGSETLAIAGAAERVLSEDIRAALDVPPFDNAAMDGFVVAAGAGGRTLAIRGEARAGHAAQAGATPEVAVRISTGAPMPPGGEAVIPVERTRVDGDRVTLAGEVAAGDHVRRAGEDLTKGDLVLGLGTVLGPGELGAAVGAGRGAVECHRRPRVALVSTGDELVSPGSALQPGQIHNSNLVTLRALAQRDGAQVVRAGTVSDDRAATETTLAGALADADVVVACGGISVGEHDHVKAGFALAGVDEVFWRIAFKPGKPTWFGTRGRQLAFGLPGNPVSAAVTWLLFVRPALRALAGRPFRTEREQARLTASIRRGDREQGVRVALQRRGGAEWATVTGPQGSHVSSSLVGAHALAFVAPGDGEMRAGDTVEIERI